MTFFVVCLTASLVLGIVIGCIIMAFALTQPIVREPMWLDPSPAHPTLRPPRPTLRLVAPQAEHTTLYDWAREG